MTEAAEKAVKELEDAETKRLEEVAERIFKEAEKEKLKEDMAEAEAKDEVTERLVPFQEAIRDGLPDIITALEEIATGVTRLASEVEVPDTPEPSDKKTRM